LTKRQLSQKEKVEEDWTKMYESLQAENERLLADNQKLRMYFPRSSMLTKRQLSQNAGVDVDGNGAGGILMSGDRPP